MYKKLLYLLIILIMCGCSSDSNIRYDYYGSAVDISELKDGYIIADDYVYAVISDGQTWNSLESPELFDLMNVRMADKDSYSKLSVNDSVSSENNTLALSQAETRYVYYPVLDEVCLVYSLAQFDGELSVKGYITLYTRGDNTTDILFLPGNGEWKGLPMLYYEDKGAWTMQEDYKIIANAPCINLGKPEDYNNSGITLNADETLREVYITINNLVLCWCEGDYGTVENSADIVNISYL